MMNKNEHDKDFIPVIFWIGYLFIVLAVLEWITN
ncbi:hypothetical protein SAMN05216325_1652 [Nitrosomonas marina]|uniref:Uncharacterized protein n=1 Tax=Nitrosomonas marina TaxID=917 RepID=A0A1H8JAG0_9PROT|nr:hypothetical protein SAMN05216325_1652 [Nitrosomonas marina]